MKPIKSFLFSPADSEKKINKGYESGADAIILDLEDSVAPENKSIGRKLATEFLASHSQGNRESQIWVRINPLDTIYADKDLAAIMQGKPEGIVLPKANGPEDVKTLSKKLDALESDLGVSAGSTKILCVATETAIAPFRLGDYASFDLPRLYGLTWGAEDLAAELGATTNRAADGGYAFTYQMVRSLTLLGAHAAGVHAVESVYTDFRDMDGLAAGASEAYAEGFSGSLVIHPAQVEITQSAYSPSDADIEHAKKVLQAFEDAQNGGVTSLDGKMLDIPHLKQARRILGKEGPG